MSLERRARPTLLRVEVPVAVDTGSVQLLIGTPAGEVADQNRFKFNLHHFQMGLLVIVSGIQEPVLPGFHHACSYGPIARDDASTVTSNPRSCADCFTDGAA